MSKKKLSFSAITSLAVMAILSGNVAAFAVPAQSCDIFNSGNDLSNFYNKSLSGCDLRGKEYGWYADLRGADLSFANLSGLTFFHADFSGANLKGAVLSKTVFISSNLSGASLEGANLNNVDIETSTLANANLNSATFVSSTLSSTNFSGVSVAGLVSRSLRGDENTFSDGVKFVNGYLVGPGAMLQKAVLTDARLNGANLTAADLTGALLNGADTCEVSGTPQALPTGWRKINNCLVGAGADLWRGALAGVNFDGIDLTGTKFIDSDLHSARFTKTVLASAKFYSVNLDSAIFSQSNLQGISGRLISGSPASLPAWIKIAGGNWVGPGADLKDAKLSYTNLADTDLTGVDLSGAQLTGVKSGGVVGQPAKLPSDSWSIHGGYLIGPEADLSNANLQNLNLSLVNLDNVDLSTANLTGAYGSGIAGQPNKLPKGWKILGGTLVGKGAVLAGADLSNANLADVNLDGADLKNVTSGAITGTPIALPPRWKLVGGYLIGPSANLENANLSNLNLSNADLSKANLSGANLVGANLTHSNLSFAHLEGASFDRAKISGSDVTESIFTAEGRQASLSGLVSGALKGSPANLPDGWNLVSGNLLGPLAPDIFKLKFFSPTLPKITGRTKVGSTLVATVSRWSKQAKAKFQWLLDGKVIAGEVLSNLKLRSRFRGHQISVRVTESAAGYLDHDAESKPVKIG